MEPVPDTPPEEEDRGSDTAPRTIAQAGLAEASGDVQEGK